MRTKLLTVIIMSACLLLGCQRETSVVGLPEIKESYVGMGGESIATQLSVYVDASKLLCIYDSNQKLDTVLCNKADCVHEPYDEISNPDPTCDAALNEELFMSCVPVISGQYVYLFGKENLSNGVVYREKLDGSERVRMYTMDYQVDMGSTVYVKDGVAYITAQIPVVTEDNIGGAGSNSSYDVFIRVDLESGETQELSGVDKQEFQNISLLGKNDENIFYEFSYRKKGKKDRDYSKAKEYTRVFRYNIEKKENQEIFSENDLSGMYTIGIANDSVCVADMQTGDAYELSLSDKEKKHVYKHPNNSVIYFVFQNKWIIGDMQTEQFYYLHNGDKVLLSEVNSILGIFGEYIEYSLQNGNIMVTYGDSFFKNEREVLLERGVENAS